MHWTQIASLFLRIVGMLPRVFLSIPGLRLEVPKDHVIGDFGCGDARLALELSNRKVHSFDLVQINSRWDRGPPGAKKSTFRCSENDGINKLIQVWCRMV